MPNTWQFTGSLNTARSAFDAALLDDGRILVTCGDTQTPSDALVSTCELYDPSTETWSFTGSVSTPRFFHNVVTLQNGKVLLIGGAIDFSNTYTTVCELYDPSLGTWSTTGSLGTARGQPAVYLLANGKVLVAGGNVSGNPNSSLASCEVYDPGTGLWTATGSLNVSRVVAGAALLANGNPIIICGNHNGGFTQTAEIYDVGLGTWAETTGAPPFSFVYGGGNTTLRLNNNKVLSAGGNGISPSLTGCMLYDPGTDTFSLTGPLTVGRAEFGLYALPDGDVLAAGGDNSPSSVTATTEIYSVAAGTWGLGSPLNTGRATGQESSTNVRLNNGDLMWIGGSNTVSVISTVERYTPAINVKKQSSMLQVF